jgi:hypothetical protein
MTHDPDPGVQRVDRVGDRASWGILAGRDRMISPWILPDRWTTPQTSVSHTVLGRRPDRAAHRLHRPVSLRGV